MVLDIWLIGLALSVAVIKIDNYCEGRQTWHDLWVALLASIFWFVTVPVALYRLWRDIRAEKAQGGES